MSGERKEKKLRPIEVGIVVLMCLFVATVIWSASKKYRAHAFRNGCTNNLSVIGKAMLAYANEYDGQLPRSGGMQSPFTGYIQNWLADNRSDAYGLAPNSRNNGTNISSCFYLLIKL